MDPPGIAIKKAGMPDHFPIEGLQISLRLKLETDKKIAETDTETGDAGD